MKRAKQEKELTEDEKNVVITVRHCARELDDILQGSRRKAQANASLFAETGISTMFRGVDSYADMYEKLNVKSREAMERLFTKFSECEEVQDTQDAIEETEENWKNFLVNLNKDISREKKEPYSPEASECDVIDDLSYIYVPSVTFIDCQTSREFRLQDFVRQYTCVFVTCQPSYWPHAPVIWRHSEMSKVECDLSQFKVGYAVVTWGPDDIVRSWSKHVHRVTKWPVLFDKKGEFCKLLGFKRGLECIWTSENLDFIGCQRAMHNYTVNPPPSDLNWLKWDQIGGELVLSVPVSWDPRAIKPKPNGDKSLEQLHVKRRQQSDSDDDSLEGSQSNSQLFKEAACDRKALSQNKTKICSIHVSSRISDLMPSGSIYQAALTCYSRLYCISESEVMDKIRVDRRFTTAPESARLQYEPTTGLFYDPETSLYYDTTRGYFYDAPNRMYYYWSKPDHRYKPANEIIQAELLANHAAQTAAGQLAARKAISEREAALKAAQTVAAQLAEIRAGKDDYAAYVYATCVLPQQESDTASCPQTASACQTEQSLKAWNTGQAIPIRPLVPYKEDVKRFCKSKTPPPPGL